MGERDELLVGLYDELVTDALQSIVDRLEAASRAQLDPLRPAEASSTTRRARRARGVDRARVTG